MPRRAAVTPGTDPKPEVTEDEMVASAAGGLVPADADLRTALAQIAELQSLVKQLGRNQAAQATPEKIKLPTMAEVIKGDPKVPVLTENGWFVPAIHPTDRIAKV